MEDQSRRKPCVASPAGAAAGACLLALAGCAILPGSMSTGSVPARSTLPRAEGRSVGAVERYQRIPLAFEKNRGQTDEEVKFLSRGGGYTLFLTGREVVLALPAASPPEGEESLNAGFERFPGAVGETGQSIIVRSRLVGANESPEVTGEGPLPGRSHYLIGNDPSRWWNDVRSYERVKYRSVYQSIDLVYYGSSQRELEYDFVVHPGGDPAEIRIALAGVVDSHLDSDGNLVHQTTAGGLLQRRPVVYQPLADGSREPVAGRFRIHPDGEIGFEVAAYDPERTLVIDPVLVYSTYLGGTEGDWATGLAIDDEGNLYVSGFTCSTNFPVTTGAYRTSNPNGGCYSLFVTKLPPQGNTLEYSTYFGGTVSDPVAPDIIWDIAVDAAGSAHVTGRTCATDFPMAAAFQPANRDAGCYEAFVSKLSPSGSSLVYSTYLGGIGSDGARSIALDATGNAYVAGLTCSQDFPVTPGAYQTDYGQRQHCGDAFVAKLTPAGALVYSTYLGQFGFDEAFGVAVDAGGHAYVTGVTASYSFPVTSGAYQTENAGIYFHQDAFLTKLSPDGDVLVYSTYFGSAYKEEARDIGVDAAGNAYIAGEVCGPGLPVKNAFQPLPPSGPNNCVDGFVTKFNPSGSDLVYSTYLGGSEPDDIAALAVDAAGSVHVIGTTRSPDFPVAAAYQDTHGGALYDAFVTKLSPSGSSLAYSTYLGGEGNDYGAALAIDDAGSAYVAGRTSSADFPVKGGFQEELAQEFGGNPGMDAYVTQFFTCGDGFLDPLEQCDEGEANGTAGGCCTEECAFVRPRTSCDDGLECTVNDVCSFGVCVGQAIRVHEADARAYGIRVDLGGDPYVAPTPDSDLVNPDTAVVLPATPIANGGVLRVEESSTTGGSRAVAFANSTGSGVGVFDPLTGEPIVSLASVQVSVHCEADATSAACSSAGSMLGSISILGEPLGDVSEPTTVHVVDATNRIVEVHLLEKIPSGADAGVPQPENDANRSGLALNGVRVLVHLAGEVLFEAVLSHANAAVTYGDESTCR